MVELSKGQSASNATLAREIKSLKARIERAEKRTKDLKDLVKDLQTLVEE